VAIHLEPPGAALRLDDKPVAILDGGLEIPPGAHRLVARAKGFQDRRIDIPAERAPDYQLTIELARVVVRTKAVPKPRSSAVDGMFTTRRKVSISVAGASVIGVTTGVVLGVIAEGKQNEAFKLCPDPATPCTEADQSTPLLKLAHSRAFAANIAFGIGAAAAIGAGVLWFTGAPDAENPRRVSVVPSVVPGETGVLVMGRF
jgi:hypothetical protein